MSPASPDDPPPAAPEAVPGEAPSPATTPRGRFAPSPSGRMHLGNAWTALLAWLSARSKGGAVVLRMEDLDPERSKEHFAALILEDLAWLGLDWDEGPGKGGPFGPYRQSERRAVYRQRLEALTARGLTYPCFCTRAELRGVTQAPHAGDAEPVYAGTCLRLTGARRAAKRELGRGAALRLRAGEARIAFEDLVLGPQMQDLAAQCGDFVVRRSDGVHAYQLAVSVDDMDHRVTEVVRGADLLDSTGRQILLHGLLGGTPPAYAHVPLLVDPDGRRLSKRRGDTDLGELRARGVPPETVTGWLAWRAGLLDRPRKASPRELADGFSFRPLPTGPVVVPENWMEDMT
ncbi:Glutamate--tRNA ligase 1 [Fundidesulfovibrio magnetotacticus]|uniref:Glutamyl-Q tRNA(Asp) synthetase n=1 Tax=Fundidesulfovibrio magnetotacticus TaxID=2730080 RepID=A0A6V8LS75_9BACT|nr:tRNA glutamyl-Q(34) synthetase GluQRS [Fundidesulfovibrio magnetotacticus]GFK93168.1 Glutamate--tRNA ligase 1 [Fundidesulfovibrio magnetotacticus]